MKKIQPKKVQRIFCPVCGELQVKIYPWSSLHITEDRVPMCQKHVGKPVVPAKK